MNPVDLNDKHGNTPCNMYVPINDMSLHQIHEQSLFFFDARHCLHVLLGAVTMVCGSTLRTHTCTKCLWCLFDFLGVLSLFGRLC